MLPDQPDAGGQPLWYESSVASQPALPGGSVAYATDQAINSALAASTGQLDREASTVLAVSCWEAGCSVAFTFAVLSPTAAGSHSGGRCPIVA